MSSLVERLDDVCNELAEEAADEITRLTIIEIAVCELEPYFDQLICYGSTTSEHKPNLLVKNMRKALAKATPNE